MNDKILNYVFISYINIGVWYLLNDRTATNNKHLIKSMSIVRVWEMYTNTRINKTPKT